MTKFKRVLACTAAVITLTASTTAASVNAAVVKNQGFRRGDVNCNGIISKQDYNALCYYYNDTAVKGVTAKSADVSGDGKVSYLDVVVMRNILSGKDKNCIFVKGDYTYFYPGTVFMDDGTYYSMLRESGNLEIYKRAKGKSDELIFESHTKYYEDFRSYKLALQTDGNVVIYGRPNYDGAKEKAIWSSGTCIYNQDEKKVKQLMLCFDEHGQFQYYGENGVVWQGENLSASKSKRSYMSYEDRRKVAEYRINYSLKYGKMNQENNGFRYSNYEAAAIDFILCYNEAAIEEQREYGTGIHKVTESNGITKYVLEMHPHSEDERDKEGNLIYKRSENNGLSWNDGLTSVHQRGRWTVAGDGPIIRHYPADSGLSVAFVHCHGHEAGWQNNYFSIEPNPKSESDTDMAINEKLIAYLGAPNGTIRRFDPSTDEVKSMKETGNIVTNYIGGEIKAPNNATPKY